MDYDTIVKNKYIQYLRQLTRTAYINNYINARGHKYYKY